METNKFSVVMSEKVDMELVRIVTSERADYQPEAVIAAEEELKWRNITPSMTIRRRWKNLSKWKRRKRSRSSVFLYLRG